MTSSLHHATPSNRNGDWKSIGSLHNYDGLQKPISGFSTDFRKKASYDHKSHIALPKFKLSQRSWTLRSFLNIPLALILIWLFVLRWGEQTVFKHMIGDCAWDRWENWVCDESHNRWRNELLTRTTASWSESTSCCSYRRSSTGGPSHLSWPSMAFIDADNSAYRSLSSKIFSATTKPIGARNRALSWRSVRWGKRVVYITR